VNSRMGMVATCMVVACMGGSNVMLVAGASLRGGYDNVSGMEELEWMDERRQGKPGE